MKKHTTPTNKTIVEIDGFDQLQLLSCHQALLMKAKHNMFCYCSPQALRSIANTWLGHFNIKPKRSWKALYEQFDHTFGEVIKANENKTDKPADPIDKNQ